MRLPASLFALLALTGCRELPLGCTNVGCADGLVVLVRDNPPGPWEIDVAAGSTTRTFTCSAGLRCTTAFFPGFVPGTVTVTVRANGRSQVLSNLTPTPHVNRPNGAHCPTACQQPRITVSLP
jgi:hypothetical protein